jgi:hypothetical protein
MHQSGCQNNFAYLGGARITLTLLSWEGILSEIKDRIDKTGEDVEQVFCCRELQGKANRPSPIQ